MLKTIKAIFSPRTREQAYLNERLQSAKWLGWEMPADASQAAKPETAKQTPAEGMLHGKPA